MYRSPTAAEIAAQNMRGTASAFPAPIWFHNHTAKEITIPCSGGTAVIVAPGQRVLVQG